MLQPHWDMYVTLRRLTFQTDSIHLDTRILLTLLMDEGARPTPHDMKLWVDLVRFLKRGAKGGALSFFTYMELSEYNGSVRIRSTDPLQRFGSSCSISSGQTD